VDFRSLTVRIRTIYEGLLESNFQLRSLSDNRRRWILLAATPADELVIAAVRYTSTPIRTAQVTGSYFTKQFAVEHLLDTALERAIDDHLAGSLSILSAAMTSRGR